MNKSLVIIIVILLFAICIKFNPYKEKFDEYEAINQTTTSPPIAYNNIDATKNAMLEAEIANQSNIMSESNIIHQMNNTINNSSNEYSSYENKQYPLVSANITDVNGKLTSGKPYANDSDISDFTLNGKYPSAIETNPGLIQKDMTCIGLTFKECQEKHIDISNSYIRDAIKNKPININQYSYSKQHNIIDTAPYFHPKKAYSSDEVNVTGNASVYNNVTGETILNKHGHVWSSNNVDDNFNKIDMKQFMKPIIFQSNIKGVSNIFAPVIYIQDDEHIKSIPYDYKMNNSTIELGNSDLLNNANPVEPDNDTGLFETDNIKIPH